MSRVKETWDVIDGVKSALIGKVDKPVLYILPVLSEIALSLAEIADNISRGEEHDEMGG